MLSWFLGIATLFVGLTVFPTLDKPSTITWPGIALFGILLVGTLIAYGIESRYDND